MGLRGFILSFQASRPSEISFGCGLYLFTLNPEGEPTLNDPAPGYPDNPMIPARRTGVTALCIHAFLAMLTAVACDCCLTCNSRPRQVIADYIFNSRAIGRIIISMVCG